MGETYYLFTTMLERGEKGTDGNYPFRNLPTFTNKDKTVYFSCQIFPKAEKGKLIACEKKVASRLKDMFNKKKKMDWVPFGGDTEEFETLKDVKKSLKSQKKFYRYPKKF